MIFLLLIILIIATIVCIINDIDVFGVDMLLAFSGVGIFIAILIILLCYPYNIDQKLSMYQEENGKIETKIKNTVQGYMDYEKETYLSFIEAADLETLLIKYPELSSNELVKSEIETYKENNEKIKKLKEQKINKNVYDFWLKFNIGE